MKDIVLIPDAFVDGNNIYLLVTNMDNDREWFSNKVIHLTVNNKNEIRLEKLLVLKNTGWYESIWVAENVLIAADNAEVTIDFYHLINICKIMTRFLHSIIVLTLFISNGICQSKLINGKTKSVDGMPISFVNIGSPAINIGTVSDQKGSFAIRINDYSTIQQLTFSHVGFQSLSLSRKDIDSLLRLEKVEIVLKEKIKQLEAIEVRAERMKKITVGDSPSSDQYSITFKDSLNLGQEIGRVIKAKVKKPYFLEQLNFLITRNMLRVLN